MRQSLVSFKIRIMAFWYQVEKALLNKWNSTGAMKEDTYLLNLQRIVKKEMKLKR